MNTQRPYSQADDCHTVHQPTTSQLSSAPVSSDAGREEKQQRTDCCESVLHTSQLEDAPYEESRPSADSSCEHLSYQASDTSSPSPVDMNNQMAQTLYDDSSSSAVPPAVHGGNNQQIADQSTYFYEATSSQSSAVAQRESQAVLSNGEIAPGMHRLPILGLLSNYLAVFGALLFVLAFNFACHPTDSLEVVLQGLIAVPVVLIIVLIQFAVVYYSFLWGLTPDGLRIKQGIIIKKDMTIPFSKIHSIHLTEPLLMRILGFVSVKIDTGASGFQAAHKIAALHRNEAEALRRDVFKYKQQLADCEQGVLDVPTSGEHIQQADTAHVSAVDMGQLDEVTRELAQQARSLHQQELMLARDDEHDASRLTQEVVKFDRRARGFFAGRSITDTDVIAERSLTMRELLWSALLNVRLGVGMGIIFACLSTILGIGGVQHWVETQVSVFEHGVEFSAGAPTSSSFMDHYTVLIMIGVLIFAFLAVLLGYVLSCVSHMVSHANFHVQRTRSRINITAGLITRNSYAIAIERVQAFVIKQSLLQRIFKYATLQVVLLQGHDETSHKGGREFKQDGKETVFPCLKLNEIPAFLDTYLPEYSHAYQVDCPMISLPGRALSRSLKRALYWALTVACIAVVAAIISFSLIYQHLSLASILSKPQVWKFVALIGVLVCVIIFALQVLPRYLSWRQTKIGRNEEALYVTKGIFELVKTAVYREKIQEIQIAQNPFQLRLDLARVRYHTAGHTQMSSGSVYDVPLECAHDLYEWLRAHRTNDKLVTFALHEAGMNEMFSPQQ